MCIGLFLSPIILFYQLPSFGYTNNLKRHIKSNHGTAIGSFIKCDKCDLTLSVSTTLKSHYKNVHSDREFTFQCDHCEKRFKSKYSLKNHLQKFHVNGMEKLKS